MHREGWHASHGSDTRAGQAAGSSHKAQASCTSVSVSAADCVTHGHHPAYSVKKSMPLAACTFALPAGWLIHMHWMDERPQVN
jgi:hypothetical protein